MIPRDGCVEGAGALRVVRDVYRAEGRWNIATSAAATSATTAASASTAVAAPTAAAAPIAASTSWRHPGPSKLDVIERDLVVAGGGIFARHLKFEDLAAGR